ncbi:MAG: hypothetical protein ABI345_01670 [Jatrophihabitans sp.]
MGDEANGGESMNADRMTVLTRPTMAQALRRAAVRATLAPSVHNTQPWRFELGPQTLDIYSDSARRLGVLDTSGRQLLISCGSALFNARVSLAASGYDPIVHRLPDPARPSLVARLTVAPGGPAAGAGTDAARAPLAALDAMVELRRTNRRRFETGVVPDDLVDLLEGAAAQESAVLFPIRSTDDRIATAVLSQRADRHQNADPAYRAELRAWTSNDPEREDGVPTFAVPSSGPAHDELPMRHFDATGSGELPAQTQSSMNQCLVLLGTEQDTPDAWIAAGEGLERVLLEITRHGYSASPLTQVVETPSTRQALRKELHLAMHPHVLLRIGRADATPAPRRRRLVDMLRDTP